MPKYSLGLVHCSICLCRTISFDYLWRHYCITEFFLLVTKIFAQYLFCTWYSLRWITEQLLGGFRVKASTKEFPFKKEGFLEQKKKQYSSTKKSLSMTLFALFVLVDLLRSLHDAFRVHSFKTLSEVVWDAADHIYFVM